MDPEFLENQMQIKAVEKIKIYSYFFSNGVFKLLCYLDPYGDTIFNGIQMNDLIGDLEKLMKIDNNKLIIEIMSLAEKCREEPHTYLAFYGD